MVARSSPSAEERDGPPPFQHLAWDSEFLGYGVARISRQDLTSEELVSLLSELRASDHTLVYWSAPPENDALLEGASRAGGRLVDEKVTFVKKQLDRQPRPAPRCSVVSYRDPSPDPDLVALALASGVHSRFRVDPRLATTAFERLYRTWIARSVSREIAWDVLVVKDGQVNVGVVTIGSRGSRADIGLLAVADSARNRGVGRALMYAAEEAALEQGYHDLQVVTQLANEAACRFYASCGYERESMERVFHFWLK